MVKRILRKSSVQERIAGSLQNIAYDLDNLVFYRKANEERQQLYADFFTGLVPMLQRTIQDFIGPRQPPVRIFVPSQKPFTGHHTKPKKVAKA
jgi:hypothetical protein